MQNKFIYAVVLLGLLVIVPGFIYANDTAQEIRGMNSILKDLFDKMMPRCSMLIDSARAIGAFGATFYIGNRIWKHICNAEAIDFYPLFKPFALCLAVVMFPSVIKVIHTVLSPAEIGTQAMVDTSNAAVEKLIAKREAERQKTDPYKYFESNEGKGNREEWLKYAHPDDATYGEDWLDSIGNGMEFSVDRSIYQLKNWFKNLISFLLELLYEAAALCINTIRTFNLLVCALLGPLVFALACYDGFGHTLVVWLARYINFYMWLPVCNILSAILGMIQEGMIKLDIQQYQTHGDSFFSTADIGFLLFMIIGIVSYFTVPNIASMVVNPGIGSALASKVGGMSNSVTRYVVGGTVGAAASIIPVVGAPIGMAADAFGDMNTHMTGGYAGSGTNSGYFKDKLNG